MERFGVAAEVRAGEPPAWGPLLGVLVKLLERAQRASKGSPEMSLSEFREWLTGPLIEEERQRLVSTLMEALGRADAQRMAGIFFDLTDGEGKTVIGRITERVLSKLKEVKG